MLRFEVFYFFKWCLQMDVVMHYNYIKLMQIFWFFMNEFIIYVII